MRVGYVKYIHTYLGVKGNFLLIGRELDKPAIFSGTMLERYDNCLEPDNAKYGDERIKRA